MNHEEIYNYVMAKYNIALGVDEIIKIVSDNLLVDQFVQLNYPNSSAI